MTTLVQQRTGHDCSICCLAMILDRPYGQVMWRAIKTKNFDPERGMFGMSETLGLFGFKSSWNDREQRDCIEWSLPFGITAEFFRQIAWGRRCLISVPSLNLEDGFHHVYFDGHRIWDPSPKKTYTDFSELRPRSILIFREGTL